MIKVIFVCLGNICRSPMADAIFQNMVKEAGLADDIMVDSAGTSQYHIGETAHRGTLNILTDNGITYMGRARQFTTKDLDAFDYVLAMDKSNVAGIHSIFRPKDKDVTVQLFLQYAFDNHEVDVLEVPDPYYSDRFEEVYDLVTKGSRALLAHLRTEYNL